MAAEFRIPLEVLAAENNLLGKLHEVLKTRIERLQGYIFSSKIRPILFKDSFAESKSDTVLRIQVEIRTIINLNEQLTSKTSLFLGKIRQQNLFSQQRHSHQTIAYMYNALHHQRKIQSILQDLEKSLLALRTTVSPAQMQAIARELRRLFSNLERLSAENQNYLQDFQGRYRIERHLRQTYEGLLEQNILKKTNGWKYLQNGDIWVSFKTASYLKKEYLSRWIARINGSQVTHVALFLHDAQGYPAVIQSNKGMMAGMKRLEGLVEGQVYIILRPKLSSGQRIQLWRVVREMIQQKIWYSKAKIIAVIPSLLLSKAVNAFSRRSIPTGNILNSVTANMFCSEFLNEVFKRIGFYLTPKSKYSSMVLPADIIASSEVEYVGLLFADDKYTKEKIMRELVEGVRI